MSYAKRFFNGEKKCPKTVDHDGSVKNARFIYKERSISTIINVDAHERARERKWCLDVIEGYFQRVKMLYFGHATI